MSLKDFNMNLHSQKSVRDEQQVHEKMLNIGNYQRNKNKKYNEVPPQTSQNGNFKISTNNKFWKG